MKLHTIFAAQGIDGSIVLTSSANAVVREEGHRGVRRIEGGAQPPGA